MAEYTGAEKELIDGTGVPEWSSEDLTVDELTGVMDLMLEHNVIEDAVDLSKLIWGPSGE